MAFVTKLRKKDLAEQALNISLYFIKKKRNLCWITETYMVKDVHKHNLSNNFTRVLVLVRIINSVTAQVKKFCTSQWNCIVQFIIFIRFTSLCVAMESAYEPMAQKILRFYITVHA